MDRFNKDKQFVVIGLGRFGRAVACTLSSMHKDVLCIDKNSEIVNSVSHELDHVVQADTRYEDVFEQLNIYSFDTAIVGINHDIESSVMTTLLLQEYGVKCIIAKASTETHKKALYKVGATKVVQPEKDMGVRVAKKAAFDNLIDYIELSKTDSIFEIKCPNKWIDKNIMVLDVRKKYNITILGIKRDDRFISVTSDFPTFRKNDIIVSIGSSTEFYKQL